MRTTAQPLRDPKTVLQEWAQARGLPTPAYREVARSGPDHNPEFRVAVHLPQLAPAEGSGRSKRSAEQAAESSRRAGGYADGRWLKPGHEPVVAAVAKELELIPLIGGVVGVVSCELDQAHDSPWVASRSSRQGRKLGYHLLGPFQHRFSSRVAAK